MQSKNFVFSLLILIFLLISGSLLLLNLSTGYIFKHAKRMPDIRKVNKEYRLNYINDYLSYKTKQSDSYIIILGDSQFYGYHQDEDDVFSNYLTKHTASTILNLAFNDARPNDVIKELEVIRSHNIKINAIIYGLNIGHFGEDNETNIRRLPDKTSYSILPLYTAKMNVDFWKNQFEKQLLHTKFSQIFTTKKAPSTPAKAPNKIDTRYPLLLKNLYLTSKKVLIISEPRSEIDVLRQAQNNTIKKLWVDLYRNETRKENLRFLDASAWMDNSCFIDNTHMNIKGHEFFSQTLLEELFMLWPKVFIK